MTEQKKDDVYMDGFNNGMYYALLVLRISDTLEQAIDTIRHDIDFGKMISKSLKGKTK